MTEDEKRTGQGAAKAESPVIGDTTTRARNRTVMMTSELTGQVRARLGGEFQRPTSERSGGFVQESSGEDDGWTSPEFDASSVTSTEFSPQGDVEEFSDERTPSESPVHAEPSARSMGDREVLSEYEPEQVSTLRAEHSVSAERVAPPKPLYNQASDDDGYVYREDNAIESESEPPQQQVDAPPARILRPKTPPRLAPLHAQEEAPQIKQQEEQRSQQDPPQRPRTTREFKPMSQEEYLETFVVPPEPEQFEEVQPKDSITWTSESTLVGFLLSYDLNPKGDYVELRTGRLMVTCEFEASGNCFVVAHPSVSPMHAIMRVGTGGTIQVLDQLSESGTKIRHAGSQEEEFLSGEKGTLNHGDIVSFGERSFYVCLIKPPTE